MKKVITGIFLFFLFGFSVHAIGLQHGLFRSQSTQGDPWQGTAKIVKEHYDITVFPDYLDVELEWEFKADGKKPAEYTDALEIVGNLNFVDNSVVVSMITWYKDMVLKGKLKTNEVAREQYEDVVERSSDAPPPPRDPVLLEWIRDDNYDISIFPVEFGKTRKVRIRYLIPAFEVNGENKISYPHAFTHNATVSVKTGMGVKGYGVETALEIFPYYKTAPVLLDTDKFEFMPYCRSNGKVSIEYIVPHLEPEPSGSVIYSGTFSTKMMAGEMSHIITMSADRALLKTKIPQDFVILWRWNHPEVLVKYAGQIVRQSKQLITFLNTLSAHGKRVAMIVSIQGGEKITFELGAPGSDGFKKMINWLDETSKRTVVEPELTSKVQDTIQFDIEKTVKEFNEAIQNALDLFDNQSTALKQLIILTAGPRLVNNYNYIKPAVHIDSAICLTTLSAYLKIENESTKQISEDRMGSMYWPGINIPNLFQDNSTPINVTATVSNGGHTYSFKVLTAKDGEKGYQSTVREAHLFSSATLNKKIQWRIELDDAVETFVETPTLVPIDNGLQYARLIGSSKYLNPLADVMPSSIASSVGFIDEKYSLVALEEDALPKDVVAQYEKQGVPLLESNEIFVATDETADMPVADWLGKNPPQSFAKSLSYDFMFFRPFGESMNGMKVLLHNDIAWVEADGQEVQNAAGRIAMPAVKPIYAEASDLTYDYSDLSDTKRKPVIPANNSLQFIQKSGKIEIDLSNLIQRDMSGFSIVICDLKGRIVKVIKLSALSLNKIFTLSTKTTRLSAGAYIVNLQSKSMTIARTCVLMN